MSKEISVGGENKSSRQIVRMVTIAAFFVSVSLMKNPPVLPELAPDSTLNPAPSVGMLCTGEMLEYNELGLAIERTLHLPYPPGSVINRIRLLNSFICSPNTRFTNYR